MIQSKSLRLVNQGEGKRNITRQMKILQFEEVLQKQKSTIRELLGRQPSSKIQIPITHNHNEQTGRGISPRKRIPLQQTKLGLQNNPYLKIMKNTSNKQNVDIKRSPAGKEPVNVSKQSPYTKLTDISIIPVIQQLDSQQQKQLQYLKSQQYKQYLDKITRTITVSNEQDLLKEMKKQRNHNVYLKKPLTDRSPKANLQGRMTTISRNEGAIKTALQTQRSLTPRQKNIFGQKYTYRQQINNKSPRTTYCYDENFAQERQTYLQKKLEELEKDRNVTIQKVKTSEMYTQTKATQTKNQKTPIRELQPITIQQSPVKKHQGQSIQSFNQTKNNGHYLQEKRQQHYFYNLEKSIEKQKQMKYEKQKGKEQNRFSFINDNNANKLKKCIKNQQKYCPSDKNPQTINTMRDRVSINEIYNKQIWHYQKFAKKQIKGKKNQIEQLYVCHKIKDQKKQNYLPNTKKDQKYTDQQLSQTDGQNYRKQSIYAIDFKLNKPEKNRNNKSQRVQTYHWEPDNYFQRKNYQGPVNKWQRQVSQAGSTITKTTDECKTERNNLKVKNNSKISVITPSLRPSK